MHWAHSERAVIDTYENLLYRYLQHPEAKSLAPDGGPCRPDTHGLLQRAHIIAARHRRIGKESDRRWEEGDDLESLRHQPVEYEPEGAGAVPRGESIASESLIRKIKKIGIRKLVRFGCKRRILTKICGREPVPSAALDEYKRLVRRYKLTQSKKGSE